MGVTTSISGRAVSVAPPDGKSFALRLVQTAAGYIGVNRAADKDQIAKFLAVFGLPFAGADGVPLPFCDAGVGYAAARTYCDLCGIPYTPETSVAAFRAQLTEIAERYFLPSARCEETRQDAMKRGTWLAASAAGNGTAIQPGWLVLYAWNGGDVADHIEIVEIDAGDTIHTIGFNTSDFNFRNGGAVARKERTWDHVLGFVKLY